MNKNIESEIITNLAIGLGPANLSIAALANDNRDIDSEFIEKKPTFEWLDGKFLKNTVVQSSILRDLVTLVDPTHSFSFLSYLHEEKKIYQFMSANFLNIPRYELSAYYKWAANKLSNVSYNEWVNEVRLEDGVFRVHTSKRIINAKNIILGVGKIPYYPEHSILDISDNSFHGMMYARKKKSIFVNKKVAVIGNNQNAAEVFYDLIDTQGAKPSEVVWLSEDLLFNTEVTSSFDSEIFTPSYNEFCGAINNIDNSHLKNSEHLLNGISQSTLEKIYHSLYGAKYGGYNDSKYEIFVNTEVVSQTESTENKLSLEIINKMTKKPSRMDVDIVIYCTGLEQKLPEFLNPIKSQLISDDKGLVINKDQSIRLAGNIDNKIFLLNSAASSQQVNNQHLALSAYNGAKVINSLIGYPFYDLSTDDAFINWSGGSE